MIEIDDPVQADSYHAYFAGRGEPCALLVFCPPNCAPVGFAYSTVRLFAWKFLTLLHGG